MPDTQRLKTLNLLYRAMLPGQAYLEAYAGTLMTPQNLAAVTELRTARWQALTQARFDDALSALALLPDAVPRRTHIDLPAVTAGTDAELSGGERAALLQAATALKPWKKGPFNLFGIAIDAEWRSDLKWARVKPQLAPLAGRRVADIGCNNGYFMFRAAAEDPALVVGFEPEPLHWLEFALVQRYLRLPRLALEPLGVEHFDLFPKFFDTILCMGILYHHTDPVGLLRKLHAALATGGQIIVECQGIPGDDPVALVPEGRYANARGVWFLPTRSCLSIWLKRAGFASVECFYDEPLTSAEQRTTDWAPIASLADFLAPGTASRTIEGLPAPRRIYFKANKN